MVCRLIGTGACRSLEVARKRARSVLTSSKERIGLARSAAAETAGAGGIDSRGFGEPNDRNEVFAVTEADSGDIGCPGVIPPA